MEGDGCNKNSKLRENGSNDFCDKTVSLYISKTDDDDYELAPPDGGWGWLVLAGSMLVNILIPGTIKSFGVLFIEFREAFQASSTTAAWIPALCYFLYSSLGPVSSILSVKYSYRTVTLLGGASAAIGMISSFWASSVMYLYLSYGLLVGIGAGLSFPPTVYIVTSYFVKLRGLANGLCISGSALGSIILPPVLRWLLETYGYRGATLIMGGVTLNVFLAAIFYEPVEQHMVRVPKSKALDDVEEEDIGIVLKFENEKTSTPANESTTIDESKNKRCFVPTGGGSPLPLSDVISPYDLDEKKNFLRSASAAIVQNVGKHQDDYNLQSRKKVTTQVGQVPQRNQTFTPGQLNSQTSLYAVPEVSTSKVERVHSQKYSLRNRLSRRSPSTSSFQYISTPYHGSTLSFQPKEFSSHLSLRSVASGSESGHRQQNVTGDKDKTSGENRSKFFDLSLLKDPMYLVILISNSTNAIGYTNFIILLPAYGVTLGFDKSLSAYLISIVSATDLIGRIGGSALSDLEFIPKAWYFVGGLAISGISLALLPFVTSYKMVGICCSVFGLASGVYVGITAVIMADMLGTERLTSSYGISLFVNGILQLIGPPLCGIWFEAAHNYNQLFHALGVILLLGASLWSYMPFIEKQKANDDMNRCLD